MFVAVQRKRRAASTRSLKLAGGSAVIRGVG
jgi:hypothetical protein